MVRRYKELVCQEGGMSETVLTYLKNTFWTIEAQYPFLVYGVIIIHWYRPLTSHPAEAARDVFRQNGQSWSWNNLTSILVRLSNSTSLLIIAVFDATDWLQNAITRASHAILRRNSLECAAVNRASLRQISLCSWRSTQEYWTPKMLTIFCLTVLAGWSTTCQSIMSRGRRFPDG